MSQSRIQEYLAREPPGAFSLSIIMVGLHILTLFGLIEIGSIAIAAAPVLYTHQVWRLFTNGLFHANLFHLAVNMTSLILHGPLLERKLGTIPFLFTVMFSLFACSIVYVCISWLGYSLMGSISYLYQPAVGFSAVLFCLLVVETELSSREDRVIYGFRVSKRYYPWLLLTFTQFLMPNISFIGHLSGILVGYALVFGGFNFMLPGLDYLRGLEDFILFRPLKSRSTFVPTPNGNLWVESDASGSFAACKSLMHKVKTCCINIFKPREDIWNSANEQEVDPITIVVQDENRQGSSGLSNIATSNTIVQHPPQGRDPNWVHPLALRYSKDPKDEVK